MLINTKEISAIMHKRLKEKYPLQFKNVTRHDIERIISYYGRMIHYILKRGGFLTMSVYKNHKRNRCIRVIPIERNIVYKELGNIFKKVWWNKTYGPASINTTTKQEYSKSE